MNLRDSHSVLDAMREQIRNTEMPRSRRSWHSAPRARGLASIATAAAVLVVVLVIALGTHGTPPAFAVTTNSGGTVTITVRQLTAVTGLNAKLASMGLRIRAVPVVHGCDAPVRVIYNGRPGPRQTLDATPLTAIDSKGRAQLPGRLVSLTVTTRIAPHQTLVLAASKTGLESVGQVVQGPAPPCVGTTASP